jgi:hypothetical protein
MIVFLSAVFQVQAQKHTQNCFMLKQIGLLYIYQDQGLPK